MVEVYLYPAGAGDFIRVRFGNGLNWHNLLIDGGQGLLATKCYIDVLQKVRDAKETADIMITHIDDDHIKSAMNALLSVNDLPIIENIFINTYEQMENVLSIPGASCFDNDIAIIDPTILTHTVPSAVSFLDILKRKNLYDRIHRDILLSGVCISDYHGAKLKFISPGEKQLRDLCKEWGNYLKEKREKEKQGVVFSASYRNKDWIKKNIEDYWNASLPSDKSPLNLSSLAFIFEYDNTCMLFTGDASSDVMETGLKVSKITSPIKVDLFKIPHHGSCRNISEKIIEYFPAKGYLLCTNGANNNPSKETLAKLVKVNRKAKIYCNNNWNRNKYDEKYFTKNDQTNYLDTGKLTIYYPSSNIDSVNGISIKEGLVLYLANF